MLTRGILAGVVAIIAFGSVVVSWRAAPRASAPQQAALAPATFLGSLDDENFARVEPSRDFQFPTDHGPHHDFRTEWWYLTGHLDDDHGQRLGLQLVLMRVALTAEQQRRASHWAATEMLAGLFSVSDPAGNRLHTDLRISRVALGLAGAKAQPMHVWLDNWHLEQTTSAERGLDLALRIATDEVALALQLRNLKSLVDASDIRTQRSRALAPFHFYVQPRLHAEGTLRSRTQQSPVVGTLSLEHAWGELPVPGGPIALDRFMLHLNDGRDLFCVRTHRADGSGKPETTGLLIGQEGRPLVLTSSEVYLEPTAFWVSQRTGARYPIRWALRVQTQGINLELLPHWENQEGVGWAPFWASAVRLRGTSPTIALAGDGFVQLNGYDDS